MSEEIGISLAGANIRGAMCDLVKPFEEKVKVGEFVFINDTKRKQQLLARVMDVLPEHAFLRRGDAWSTARREQYPIPYDVGKQFVSCPLEVLGEVTPEGLRPPRASPFPGSKVVKPLAKELKKVLSPREQETTVEVAEVLYHRDVPFPLLPSHIPEHLAVFGKTGSGKSFTTGMLIERFQEIPTSKGKVRYPLLVIDPHGDYREYGQKMGELYGLPSCTNPEFQHVSVNLNDLTIESLAEMIIGFYSGAYRPSDIQISALRIAIEAVATNYAWRRRQTRELRPDNQIFTNATMRQDLEAAIDATPYMAQTLGAVHRAVEKFERAMNVRGNWLIGGFDLKGALDRWTRIGKLVVFDVSADGAPGISIRVKQFFVGYIAHIIFDWFSMMKVEGEDRFMILLLEESQNYCPDLNQYSIGSPFLAMDELANIATQGRKFGASLCLVTQRPAYLSKTVVAQCNSFFVHRISPRDKVYVSSAMGGLPEDLENKITVLERGEVVVSGTMVPVDFPLMMKVRREHRKMPHKAGTVKPIEALKKLQSK